MVSCIVVGLICVCLCLCVCVRVLFLKEIVFLLDFQREEIFPK